MNDFIHGRHRGRGTNRAAGTTDDFFRGRQGALWMISFMDATEEGEQTRSTAGCAFTLREWRSKAVKDFPARHLYTSTARHLYTSTLVLGYLGNRLQCRAGFRCGNRDVLRFSQMLDLLHGHGVAGQARHAPPLGGVVPHQPEHLVQQNTFLRSSAIRREQRKPWVVHLLEAVKAASGDGINISHVISYIWYTIRLY